MGRVGILNDHREVTLTRRLQFFKRRVDGKLEPMSSLNRLIIENSRTRRKRWELGGKMTGKWSFAFNPWFWRSGGTTTVELCQGCQREEEGRLLSPGPALPDLTPASLPLKAWEWIWVPLQVAVTHFPLFLSVRSFLKCFHSGGGRNGDLSKLTDPCKLPVICSKQNGMYFTNLVPDHRDPYNKHAQKENTLVLSRKKPARKVQHRHLKLPFSLSAAFPFFSASFSL